uniref:Uncharacterized protein n=1 Tax=Arundo donax TaxID=35708 RepID=A0A0A9CDA1_ARUDO
MGSGQSTIPELEYTQIQTLECRTQAIEQIKARCASDTARKANIAPEQRQAKRDREKTQYCEQDQVSIKARHACQRLYYDNMTLEQKQTKK